MSTASGVVTNTAWLFSERIAGRLLGLVLTVILARTLGTIGYGSLSFAVSFAALFMMVADMGVGTLVTRDLAGGAQRAPSYFGSSVVFVLPLVAVTAAGITIAALVARVGTETLVLILLMAAYNLLKVLGNVYTAVFKAFERMRFFSLTMIAERVVLFLFCVVALETASPLIGVGIAYALAGAFFCFLSARMVSAHFLKPVYRVQPAHWKYLLREGFPLAATGASSVFYYNVDMIMLGQIHGDQSVGIYSAAYRLFFTLATFFNPILTAVFPVMSRMFRQSANEGLLQAYRSSFKFLFGLSLPLTVGGFILADGIIDFVYGARFAASAPVFRWFVAIIFVGYVNSVNNYFLTSVRRQVFVAKSLAVTALVNLILNALLIPSYGESGAVWATMATEVMFLVITVTALPAPFRRFDLGAGVAIGAVAATMGAVVYYLDAAGVRLLAVVPAGAAVYFLGLALVRYVSSSEIDTIRRAIGRGN